MKRPLFLVLVVATLALLAGVAGAVAWAARELHRPHAGWTGEQVDVVLEPGLSATGMLERLAARGVISRPALVRAWLLLDGGSDALHAGEYRFRDPASALEVLDRLRRGDVLLHPVTVPEGLVLGEIAQRVAAAGFGPPDALLAAFRDPVPIAELDPLAEDLEGYLFPETYFFAQGTPAAEIASTMVRRFRQTALPQVQPRLDALGMSLREVVTLASMIEEETARPEERAVISQVFHNRLRRGMKLQCDPTVSYAWQRAGRPVERLTYGDLELDSPWNTYRVAGLPPGPIANPGLASLIAAVDPSEGEALYFVAAPGGGHRFSADLESHLEAVAEWRRYSRSSR